MRFHRIIQVVSFAVVLLSLAGQASAATIEVTVDFTGSGLSAADQTAVLNQIKAKYTGIDVNITTTAGGAITLTYKDSEGNGAWGGSDKKNKKCHMNAKRWSKGGRAAVFNTPEKRRNLWAETGAHELGHLLCAVHNKDNPPSLMTVGSKVSWAQRAADSRSFIADDKTKIAKGIAALNAGKSWKLDAKYDEDDVTVIPGFDQLGAYEPDDFGVTFQVILDDANYSIGHMNDQEEYLEWLQPAFLLGNMHFDPFSFANFAIERGDTVYPFDSSAGGVVVTELPRSPSEARGGLPTMPYFGRIILIFPAAYVGATSDVSLTIDASVFSPSNGFALEPVYPSNTRQWNIFVSPPSTASDAPLTTVTSSAIAAQGTTFLAWWNFDSGGACASEGWVSVDLTTAAGYGDFAGLYTGLNVVQLDPCAPNTTCLWGFFDPTATPPNNYACGGFPSQGTVPYVNENEMYITNEVWSPTVPFVGTGSQVCLQFDVYRDLPLNALVFYSWRVRSWVGGTPGPWRDYEYCYYGSNFDWLTSVHDVGDLVEPGATDIQVALGVADLAGMWTGVFGDGACHTNSPLFDNVRLYRVNTQGPRWCVRDIDLLQDNFATDGTTTGTVRADMATDILPNSNPRILPGDSAVVMVADPINGLGTDPNTGGPAVYCYVAVWPQNQPGKGGAALTDDSFRYPVVDSIMHDGAKWYCIRMDTSFTDGTARNGAVRDKFCVDLNDNLFTPSDTICFFFCAVSDTPFSYASYYSLTAGTTDDRWEAASNPMEFTCLPAGGWNNGGDILYVDGMSSRGAQPYFDSAFDMLGILAQVDRYDVRGPSSGVSNRLGGRVVDVFQQLLPCYRKIIWNTGDLSITLGNGPAPGPTPEKADDYGILYTFLDNLPSPGGLYLNGDDCAEIWHGWGSGSSQPLKDVYINFSVIDGNHRNVGLPINPRVYGEPGSCFEDVDGPDTLVAYAGCPSINDFDVLTNGPNSSIAMSYGAQGSGLGATIAQRTVNAVGDTVGVLLSGYSFHYIRDDRPKGVLDRSVHLYRIITWLENTVAFPVSGGSPGYVNSMDQNYPNPFNPNTTIKFSLREQTHVSLKIYNVAGQLVKTLVDDVRRAGVQEPTIWDGRNNSGMPVSSGVYFYKLVTKNFTQTKKMVLLK